MNYIDLIDNDYSTEWLSEPEVSQEDKKAIRTVEEFIAVWNESKEFDCNYCN